MKISRYLLPLAILLLSGCFRPKLPPSPYFQPRGEATATLVLLREWRFFHGSLAPTVEIDGEPQFYLFNGSYKTLYLTPGRHHLHFTGDDWNQYNRELECDVELENNTTKYYQLDLLFRDSVNIAGAVSFFSQSQLVEVIEDEALAAIKEIED